MKYRDLLYGQKTECRHVFIYQINSGGDRMIRETGEIEIHFKNKKFDHVIFPFKYPYSRNAWRILSAIEQMITEIEEQFENESKYLL